MYIPSNNFIYINIIIILIYVISSIIALKNGFLLQIVSLLFSALSLFIAWFISPILANFFPLINQGNASLNIVINSFIYTIIVFVVLKITYWFIKPLLKFVSKIPVIGWLNKLGGFLLGIINGTIIVLVLSLCLNTSVFTNAVEIKKNTLFKYSENLSKEVINLTTKHLNFDLIKNKIDDFDADEARKELTKWIIRKGIVNE